MKRRMELYRDAMSPEGGRLLAQGVSRFPGLTPWASRSLPPSGLAGWFGTGTGSRIHRRRNHDLHPSGPDPEIRHGNCGSEY